MSMAFLNLLSKQLVCDERRGLAQHSVYFLLMETHINDVKGLI